MSVEMESLSSILGDSFGKGETAKADPAPPAAEPKVEAPIAQPEKTEVVVEPKVETSRDESGRFTPKAEPKTEKAPLQPADVAAIIDERRKRQALEQRLAQLEGGKPKPDIWENPEEFVNSKLQSYVDPLKSELLNLQVENARLRNPDFDESMMAFLEAAQKDPNLSVLADNASNPLQFIYREGKRIKELAAYDGDINKRDEAKFGELTKERDALKAQLEQLTKAQAELAAVPRSLNKGQSGAAPKLSDVDDDALDKIVRFK